MIHRFIVALLVGREGRARECSTSRAGTATPNERIMSAQSLVSPDDQRVTFVELFFDLVFVFSVTQVVGLIHGRIDALHVGQAVLAFWLVWWAWTQFTWALNAADTTHPFVQLATLAATGVAFFMAIAIPNAFADGALRFALPYVLVRTLGLVLYARVARAADPSQHAAVRRFALVSVGGLAAVLAGGFAGGSATYWLWGLAILLDVAAAALGAQSEGWNIHPEHFSERHSLFVIIALGETLIVAAGGVAGDGSGSRILVAAAAVALTCAMWWTYFPRASPALEHGLAARSGSAQSETARDAFSLLHFPMLLGVIAGAVGVEEAVTHPTDPLALPARLALGCGVALFVGGMVFPLARCTGRLHTVRLVLAVLTGALVALVASVPPLASVGIAFTGAATVALYEERLARRASGVMPALSR
jgi:low temperature requirement protein LtrA